MKSQNLYLLSGPFQVQRLYTVYSYGTVTQFYRELYFLLTPLISANCGIKLLRFGRSPIQTRQTLSRGPILKAKIIWHARR